jgi:hypothetical protein
MWILLLVTLLVSQIQAQTSATSIEYIITNINEVIKKLGDSYLWAPEQVLFGTKLYNDHVLRFSKIPAGFLVAGGDCIASFGSLWWPKRSDNIQEVFSLFEVQPQTIWQPARKSNRYHTTVNPDGTPPMLLGDYGIITWTSGLTDAGNCAALYPPNESQELYQYSKVACNSPQTYICSKPVQDYFRQEKLQSRKATLNEISLSLQLSKESLESAKASLAAQENSEEVKNITKTYIEAAQSDIETSAEDITEELGKQKLSISTISQTAQFITDNINVILRKLSEDKLLQVITTLDNLKTKLEKQKKVISK